MSNVSSEVVEILEQVCRSSEIRSDPQIDLFEEQLLDSLGFVELIVALSEKFHIQISPADVERSEWSTPAKIISIIEGRVLP